MRRIALALLLALHFAAHAQAPAALGRCIVEHLDDKDRGDLAQWVFVSMAAHPQASRISSVRGEDAERASQAVGALVTRLMTGACATQLHDAAAAGGPPVIPSAVQFLTQIGVQELMTNRDVLRRLSGFSRFADRERIDRLTGQATTPR
jgi:hypothetical protein